MASKRVVEQLMLKENTEDTQMYTTTIKPVLCLFYFREKEELFITQYLMHTAEQLPVKHGHLIGQVLGAHQLKGRHGASRGAFLVWQGSLKQIGAHLSLSR